MTNRIFVKSGNAVRMFLFSAVIFLMVGIWLTGFDQVHWFLYVIPVGYTLSALFGICPSINLWRILFRND